ncbi:predicted protein [Naegleria gruberi]|uniref:histidine--tRNA ligase n=1 Tax=Naegleria gruberi TaxID=5762 RepID=D2VA04_NAEGR|nr:uncharacterized protein NAEGRDRAFT_32290 [Naegleria gruberi]EFC46342.1 predicted protein [Naegleria gruberi]|eukprot:XP_002679086.1 predicted protein [Naegleria gruberi strain NEG-M]
MADFLPSQFSTKCYSKIIRVGEQTAKTFDYQFAQTPIVEERKLFERTLGADTDIISKEMFILSSRDAIEGNKLCLRPEGTAPIMRSVIENALSTKQRIYYYGPMFRYERPQKGRYRQFHQFGVEYLGSDHYQSDLESLEMAYQFLTNVLDGRNDVFQLEINSIGTLKERENYQHALLEYVKKNKELFDQEENLSKDSRARVEIAIAENNPRRIWRILDSKQDEDFIANLIEKHDMPQLAQFQSEENRKRFENVLLGLKWLKIPYKINSSLIRGLDYYTHTTFEFKSNVIGAKSTILAGGRYDTLSQQLGANQQIPAVGWASGFERLSLIMEELEKGNTQPQPEYIPKVFVSVVRGTNEAIDQEMSKFAIILSQQLRKQGITINYFEKGNLSKQLKQAQQSKSLLTIIIGEDELKGGKISIKNMESGEQKKILLESLTDEIQESLQSYLAKYPSHFQ